MKEMQRLSLITALFVVLLLAASPAVAQDTVFINPWCGDVQVPPGTPIVLRWGWVADSQQLDRLFVDTGSYFLIMDRKPVRNTGDYWTDDYEDWGDPDEDGDTDWRVWWEYDVGPLEGVGDTHEFFSFYVLRDKITDGLDFDHDGLPDRYFGPGLLSEVNKPPWRCTVTAVQP